MNDNSKKRLKKILTLRTVGSRIIFTCLVDTLILVVLILLILNNTMMSLDTDLTGDRLKSDILYLEDTITGGKEAHWHLQDGALYCGDILIGDGTEENAFLEPFYSVEKKTGTFSYTFVRCPDEGLGWTGDETTGYVQGHFMRVAGSTKGVYGESIIGTHIEKQVADALEKDGEYTGEANVEGGDIFCYYRALYDDSGEIIGSIVAGRSMNEMVIRTTRAGSSIIWLILLVVASAGVSIIVITRRWTLSVTKVRQYLARIAQGEFPRDQLRLHSRDELEDIEESVNNMVASLREKERIGDELSLATDIQAHMLPSIFPPFPDHDEFDIFASMNPAKEVGGDFYDFFMLDEKHVVVVIADVSGKGVPAALFMVIAKTLIKNYAQMALSPAEVFTTVNRILCEGNDASLFVTSWMGLLNLETGVLTYANAGHNPPLVRRSSGEYEFLRSKPGFVLAGMEGMRYRQNTLEMKPGDRLFLYTDGVTEATNRFKQMYGEQRLLSYLNAHTDEPLTDVLKGLKKDIEYFENGAEPFDDVTMLILEFIKQTGGDGMTEKVFPAEDSALADVTAFVEEELEKTDCPPKAMMQISVALEEIFVNVAHYAYPGMSGMVRIAVNAEPGKATIRFADRGVPFNPLEQEAPDITISAEERQIGGLGIFMVRKTMDEVEYRNEDKQNILMITKKWEI